MRRFLKFALIALLVVMVLLGMTLLACDSRPTGVTGADHEGLGSTFNAGLGVVRPAGSLAASEKGELVVPLFEGACVSVV